MQDKVNDFLLNFLKHLEQMVNQVEQEDYLIYLFLMSIIELDLLWNFVLDHKMMV